METTSTTIIHAYRVREGDVLHIPTASGVVTKVPEWEDVDTWGDGSDISRVGHITCVGFESFVDYDQMVVIDRR